MPYACPLHGRTLSDWCWPCVRDGRLTLVKCERCWSHKPEGLACASCRRRKRRAEVRSPPRPPFEGQKGRCSMCGETPTGRRRTWCSQRCVDLWNLATFPAAQLKDLRAQFGPVCWVCWDEPGLEIEHVRPLWSLTEEERQELRWWLPFNLQLIGLVCHREKNRREAAERARSRRGLPPAEAPAVQASLLG